MDSILGTLETIMILAVLFFVGFFVFVGYVVIDESGICYDIEVQEIVIVDKWVHSEQYYFVSENETIYEMRETYKPTYNEIVIIRYENIIEGKKYTIETRKHKMGYTLSLSEELKN